MMSKLADRLKREQQEWDAREVEHDHPYPKGAWLRLAEDKYAWTKSALIEAIAEIERLEQEPPLNSKEVDLFTATAKRAAEYRRVIEQMRDALLDASCLELPDGGGVPCGECSVCRARAAADEVLK